MSFKVGDRVECIDNTNIPLTLYQEYIVVEGGSMGITVVDDSGYRSYLRHARLRLGMGWVR